jgi:hypothetical protein
LAVDASSGIQKKRVAIAARFFLNAQYIPYRRAGWVI